MQPNYWIIFKEYVIPSIGFTSTICMDLVIICCKYFSSNPHFTEKTLSVHHVWIILDAMSSVTVKLATSIQGAVIFLTRNKKLCSALPVTEDGQAETAEVILMCL